MDRRSLLARGVGLGALFGIASVSTAAVAARSPAATGGMVVEAVQMPAWINLNGKRQPIAPGDMVSRSQEVETASQAGLVLRLPEGSLVRLGEKSRLGVTSLDAVGVDSGRTAVRSQLQLFEGFFRFTTSAVAKAVGQREIDLKLRTATVGIRGTDFWSMTDSAHDATCLFEGKVELDTPDQGALSLDKPTAFWARFFDKPAQPVGNATPDELNKFLRTTEIAPGKGVAVAGGRWRVVAAAVAIETDAQVLATRLRDQGYPAQQRAKDIGGRRMHEVRINGLATRDDAQAILDKIAGIDGVRGRVALTA